MSNYINIGNAGFRKAREAEYVDKSMLIPFINSTLGTERCMTCVTRARRFGKSMAANMLCAYYDQSCDSHNLFQDLRVAEDPNFKQFLNKYPVIYLDMTSFMSKYGIQANLVKLIQRDVKNELCELYPDISLREDDDLMDLLIRVVEKTHQPFFCIIDEWDAICREEGSDNGLMDEYVNLLRRLFKTPNTARVFIGVYMTGILPIKRYNTQSALNNFEEYTMLSPAQLAGYFGFTENEVKVLCEKYGTNAEEMKRWYDGYQLGNEKAIYNPFAVMKAVYRGSFESYWASTNVFEGLKRYITMNFDGLKDAIVRLIAGGKEHIDPLRFSNDMHAVASKDDVLTILCHLGYLCYDNTDETVYLPNYEVRKEFERTLRDTAWTEVIRAVNESEYLLKAVLNGEEDIVAKMIDRVHAQNTSILQYNDENSLSCVLNLAFYAARGWYTIIRELPTGLGFADIVLLPHRDTYRPAMVLELKWDKSANSAIRQIHEKRYVGVLKDFVGEVILVGVNYDKKTKKHSCIIEKVAKRGTERGTERGRENNLCFVTVSRSIDDKISRIRNVIGRDCLSAQEIMNRMQLKGEDNFRKRYLNPALKHGHIARLYPNQPNRRDQKYYVI